MLAVRLLGKFDVQCDGKPVILPSRAAQSLFAYLILTAGTLHRREKLAGMLWPDENEQKARTYLRNELWRIRKALASSAHVEHLLADHLTIGFHRCTADGLDVTSLKKLSDTASAEELIQALSRYQGELLPGFYEDWLILEREHLQVLVEQKLAWLLEILEKEQRWKDILEWAERWISLGPAPETPYRALMVAYGALGDQARVSSTYERCKEALRQLDLEPSEPTRAIAFKRSSKITVPVPLTSFIGREEELKEVVNLFSKSRLITLTGAGGVGKTRLAIQVTGEIVDVFLDGVYFLDLAPLNHPARIPNTLASLLGLQGSGKQPLSDLLIDYFRSRTALVIFDNCEHLIDSTAQLIHALLTSCEGLSILATSREALQLEGEITYRVPSLAVPGSDLPFELSDLASVDSVRLFTERAALINPDFLFDAQNAFDIACICQRLDGIPLAIELAAARTNLLSAQQILTGLDDRFQLLTRGLRSALPRHQTLRAMIEWSYDLLTEKESTLFRRLAVFTGGWAQEAAENVCSGNRIQSTEVFDLLSQLVDKSLVLAEISHTGKTRYRALETIRQYAHQKLTASGEEEAVREKHTRWCLQFAERAEPHLSGPNQIECMDRLEQELDNVRAAMEWSLDNDFDLGLRIANALVGFWVKRDHRIECLRYVETLLKSGRIAPNPLHARSLAYAAWLAISPTNTEQMTTLAEAGEKMSRKIGEKEGLAVSLSVFAQLCIWQGEHDRALRLYEEGMVLLEDASRAWWRYLTLAGIGWTSQALGDYQRADAAFREAMAWSRERDDLEFVQFMFWCLGMLSFEQSHYEQALDYFQESASLARRFKNKFILARTLRGMGEIKICLGQYTQANTLLEESLMIQRDLGNPWDPAWTFRLLGRAALLQGDYEHARKHYAESLRLVQTYDSRQRLASCLVDLAELALLTSQFGRAATLLGAAEAIPEIYHALYPHARHELENQFRTIQNQLDPETYASDYETGKCMSLDEALTYAWRGLR